MSGSKDWLGGYTLEELLGSEPVSTVEKKKSMLSKIIGAPVRLVLAIVKLPFTVVSRLIGGVAKAVGEVVKLPARLIGALISPWRKNKA